MTADTTCALEDMQINHCANVIDKHKTQGWQFINVSLLGMKQCLIVLVPCTWYATHSFARCSSMTLPLSRPG